MLERALEQARGGEMKAYQVRAPLSSKNGAIQEVVDCLPESYGQNLAFTVIYVPCGAG